MTGSTSASAHVFINGRWKSRVVSFTMGLEQPEEGDRSAVLLVKSTFLEFGDGLSLRERFRQMRQVLTDPIFDKDSYVQLYEPGIDRIDLEPPTPEKPEEVEDTASNAETADRAGAGAGAASAASVAPSSASSAVEVEETEVETLHPEVETAVAKVSKGKPKTTVMLRNLPNNYTRSMLLHLLDERGFTGKYDFLYLPIDFERKANLGYAFVNMVLEDDVDPFWKTFDGFGAWSFPSSKVCQVSWSGPKQGLKAHIDRYKNSPVMHKSVPEEYKPMIFSQGVPKRFPAPTIRVQHPKKAGKH